MIGEIILVNDITEEVESHLARLEASDVRVFEENEIQHKHLQEIIAEAYIATERVKTIIIAAHSFRIEAQNALLKILEEPPNNIKFILISRNKTAFIPTIRSRLLLSDKRTKQTIPPFPLDITELTLEGIYTYIKELSQDKQDSRIYGRVLIAGLLQSIADARFTLGREELERFDSAIVELENYRPKHIVCLNLLLMFYYTFCKSTQTLELDSKGRATHHTTSPYNSHAPQRNAYAMR